MTKTVRIAASTQSLEEEIIARSMQNFERLPMLDVIFERFSIALANALKTYTGSAVDVSFEALRYRAYSDVLRNIPDPCLLAIAEASPWEGPLAVSMDASFLYSALEMMLGGQSTGKSDKGSRSFTSIERRMGQKLASLTLTELESAFRQISEVSFAVERMEGNVQLATISQPNGPCIHACAEVRLGEHVGQISVILPLRTIEPVRPLLSKVFFGERLGADRSWRDHLEDRITRSSVSMTAVLHEVRLPMNDILAWKPGSTFDLHIEADHEATVTCSGRQMFRGAMGRRQNGSVALRITEDLIPGEKEKIDAVTFD